MVQLLHGLLALTAAVQTVYGSAFELSDSALKQSHRVKQVEGGKKPHIAIALANTFKKYKKTVPPQLAHLVSTLEQFPQDVAITIRDEAEAEHWFPRAASTLTTKTTSTKTTTSSVKSTTTKSTSASTGSVSPTLSTTTLKSTSTSTTSIAASSSTAGVVQAIDLANDRQYLVPVSIANITFLLNFDTGSSDFWVFSTLLPASQRGSHSLYPVGTPNDPGFSFSVAYGEGSSAAGVVNVDQVVVGGVTATVQAVEAATSVSSSFVTGVQDGIVGLGFIGGNQCTPGRCYGLIHQLAGVLPKTLFTATLRHNAAGEYDLGFIDSSKYTGDIVYTDVVDLQGAGYWEFVASGYSIGNGGFISDKIDAFADTGTSLLVLDPDVVNAYYNGVPGATYNSTLGYVIFPCSSASSLPSFSLYIEGVKRTMPAAYGVYGNFGNGYCAGGITSNEGNGLSVIGDVFLKSQFVVFDVCLQRLGWAQQAGVTV